MADQSSPYDLPPGATPDPTYEGDWVRENPGVDPQFEQKPNQLMPPVLFRGPGGTGAGQNAQLGSEDLPPGAVPDTGQGPQRTAAAPPGQTPAPGTSDFMKDVYSAGASGNAMYQHLMGNSLGLIDKSVDTLSSVLGIPKTQIFKHYQDIFEEKAKQSQATAAEYAAGREDDFGSNLNRSLLGGAITAAPWMTGAATGAAIGSVVPGVGTALGGAIGGILGQAGVGALSESDKGLKGAVQGGVMGAVQGAMMEVMGPASRLIKVPVMVGLQAYELQKQGVPWNIALANALGASAPMTMHPGQMGAGETLQTMGTNLRNPEINIPPMFPNKNAASREAMQWMADQGVHVPAPAASGSRFLGGVQRAAEATPFGGMIGEAGRQKTVEGVRDLSDRLVREASPDVLPSEHYRAFQEAENAPESTRQIPTGKTDAQGKPITEDIQMPVNVGALKPSLKPIYDEMQWMPMADRNSSAGYRAVEKILNGPDYIPASQAEIGLSGIKAMIRSGEGRNQGLAKFIAPKLQGLIDGTVQEIGGDDAVSALQQGRVTAAKQAGADWLSEVFDRAKAEGEFNRQDALWNRWLNLPEEAKRSMYTPRQVSDLNNFFLGVKNLFRNVNPSGTAQVSAIGHLLALPVEPLSVATSVLSGAGIAKLLDSKLGVKLLTEGLTIGGKTPRANEIRGQLRGIMRGEEPPEGPESPGGGTPPGAPSGGGGKGYDFWGDIDKATEGGLTPEEQSQLKDAAAGKTLERTPAERAQEIRRLRDQEGKTYKEALELTQKAPLPFDQKMQSIADDAMQRMKDRGTFSGTQLNAVVPVDAMKDMAIWGAAKLAQGVKSKTAFFNEILDDVGEHAERFRPLLPQLYADSQKEYARFLKATSGLPNTRKLIQMFNEGREGAEWYDKTREELHKIFGPKDGDLMIRLLAATSPNTTVPSNVTLALKAFQQMKSGEDFHGEGGSPGYLPVVKDMLRAIRDGGDEDSVGGLKVQSFRKNLLGETDPVTIDRWMKRIFNFKSAGSITDPQYKFMDYQVTRLAKKLDMEPRQVQAALWKAIRESSGETSSGAPFEELVNKRLAKNDVLRKLAEQSRGADKPPIVRLPGNRASQKALPIV